MTTGHNYTRHFALEGRQHDLLGFDLGEGPKRRTLVFGMVVIPVWCVLTYGVLSLVTAQPLSPYTSALYMIPPVLLVFFGMQESPRTSRRRRITDWILRVRYPIFGHRPVIRLGARRATRAERVPLTARWQFVGDLIGRVVPSTQRPPWDSDDEDDDDHEPAATGPQLAMNQRCLVMGSDELLRQLTNTRKAKTHGVA